MSAEAEHREGDQGVGGLEAERDPGDESNLGVDGLGASVGQAVFDRGEDPVTVRGDRAG